VLAAESVAAAAWPDRAPGPDEATLDEAPDGTVAGATAGRATIGVLAPAGAEPDAPPAPEVVVEPAVELAVLAPLLPPVALLCVLAAPVLPVVTLPVTLADALPEVAPPAVVVTDPELPEPLWTTTPPPPAVPVPPEAPAAVPPLAPPETEVLVAVLVAVPELPDWEEPLTVVVELPELDPLDDVDVEVVVPEVPPALVA